MYSTTRPLMQLSFSLGRSVRPSLLLCASSGQDVFPLPVGARLGWVGGLCVELALSLRTPGRDGQRQRTAETRDRTGDLQIFSLTLSQLSYRGLIPV